MQPPYIGSKISLISKLDIRYEGTLYTVDPIESTIALAKVHSYGTEDRRTPVFVPPRDEVYDFIIFKAGDIKDLIVCEQQKATSPQSSMAAGLPYDPAIVSISKNPPPEPKLPSKLMDPGTGQGGAGGGGGAGANTPGRPGARQSFEQLMGMGSMHFSPRYPNYSSSQQQRSNKHDSGNLIEEPPQVFDKDYDFEKANEQFQEKISEDLKDKEEQPKVAEEKEKDKQPPTAAVEDNGTVATGTAADESVAIDGAADDAAVVEVEQQQPQLVDEQKPKEEFYNKTLSFFDCISCDSLEKEAGKNVRPDWKRERQTNQETFGHIAVRNLFFQRRGAMRGYHNGGGGGGGYRPNYRYQPNYYQQQQQAGGHQQQAYQPHRFNQVHRQQPNGQPQQQQHEMFGYRQQQHSQQY